MRGFSDGVMATTNILCRMANRPPLRRELFRLRTDFYPVVSEELHRIALETLVRLCGQ